MSKRFRKLSHTIYECKYHLIFCPKYRYEIFKDEKLKEETKKEIEKLVEQKEGLEIMEINVQEDHVHLLMWIPPKYSVSSVMGYLKGKAAIRIFQSSKKMREKYRGRHLWSRGYCVSTIGIDEEQIRQYVKWQKKKEQEMEQLQRELFEDE